MSKMGGQVSRNASIYMHINSTDRNNNKNLDGFILSVFKMSIANILRGENLVIFIFI